jgi:hypothetical protein
VTPGKICLTGFGSFVNQVLVAKEMANGCATISLRQPCRFVSVSLSPKERNVIKLRDIINPKDLRIGEIVRGCGSSGDVIRLLRMRENRGR